MLTITEQAAEIHRLSRLASEMEAAAMTARAQGDRQLEGETSRIEDETIRAMHEAADDIAGMEPVDAREVLVQLMVLRDQVEDALASEPANDQEIDRIRDTFARVTRGLERATGQSAADVLPYFAVPAPASKDAKIN